MSNKNYTKEGVQAIAKSLIGKTFGELNSFQLDSDIYTKGSFGHILEEDVFGYGKNSNSEPDFKDIGIELKVTPYKINQNKTLSAKERLVLNIINYNEEYKKSFDQSQFWNKNKMIQIVWYLYEKDKLRQDFKITNEMLFEFPEDDMPIILQDWHLIMDKIKNGKAHEISESDTMYLGACTKGVNANSMRTQPFSDIPAKQRAFSLKQSYMTELVRQVIGGKKRDKFIPIEKIKVKTFEENIRDTIKPYIGYSQKQLMNHFKFYSNAKNLNELLICRIFGVKSDLSKKDEFNKASIIVKTIRVESSGKIKESLPFPAFSFEGLVSEEWDDSEIKNFLSESRFLFFIFKEISGEYVLSGYRFWNMTSVDIDKYVYPVWEKTKRIVENGDIVKSISNKGKRKTNFPGMTGNLLCHVRPHAVNKKDVYPLPIKDKVSGLTEYMKHSFWINSSYLSKIVNEPN